jgi:hypothetical protein
VNKNNPNWKKPPTAGPSYPTSGSGYQQPGPSGGTTVGNAQWYNAYQKTPY